MMQSTTNHAGPLVREKISALQAAGRMATRVLQGSFQPENLVFCLPPSRSHILWLAGHIALSLDRMTAGVTGASAVLPESYNPLFAIGSQPVNDVSAYPPLSELIDALGQALAAATARLETLGDADLARLLPESMPIARIYPTVGELLAGAVIHLAYHTGQISLLQRAQGLPSPLGV